MNQAKKYALLCILLFFMPVIIVGGTNYVIDPFQIYHKQLIDHPMFFSDQRFQNAGKINSYLAQDGYDSIIMGHSQTDNFLPSQVAKKMGWQKVMKLTIDGGEASEQATTLNRALSKKNIKHVLWGVGHNYTINDKEIWHAERPFPHYFYTETLLDDGIYIFSLDSFCKSFKIIAGDLDNSWSSDLEMLNYWMIRRVKSYISFSSPENLNEIMKKRKKISPEYLKKLKEKNDTFIAADYNLINIVKNHPDVHFVIFFNPYFRGKNPKNIIAYALFQKYIVQQCADYRNVDIFGFSDIDIITANAANYRDVRHYHSGVNLLMLDLMAAGKNKLTVNNIEDYVNRISKLSIEYEIAKDFTQMIPLALESEQEKFNELLKTSLEM